MRIAICDDEKEIRELLAEKTVKLYPQADVSLWQSGEKLLSAGEKPDILLLDIQMQRKDGMETARELRKQDKAVIIIFVTALSDFVFQAFDVGAFHYLVKPFDVVELVARVEAVLRRYNKTEQHLTAGDVVVDVEARRVTKGGKPVILTNKEFGLLLLFMKNKNVALFREKLYETVWEGEYFGDSRTLDLHVQRLRRKLGWEHNLVAVYKVGYRLEVPQ